MRSISILIVILLSAATLDASHLYQWTDLDRARETTMAMLSWRTALDGYAVEHGKYPDVKTLAEARDAVVPRFMFSAPMVDSWGHPYRFERDAKNGFRIISAGADGKFTPETWSIPGLTSSFNDDVVITGGNSDWLFRYWELRDKCSQ